MKKWLVILLLLPCVAFGQGFSKLGVSRDTLGNYLLKSWKKDTLIVSLDTTKLRKNIADSLDRLVTDTTLRETNINTLEHGANVAPESILRKRGGKLQWIPQPSDSLGGIKKYLIDPGYPQAINKKVSGSVDTVYNLLYMAQDFTRSNGAISSFANGSSDSNRITFDANTAWILPPGQVVYQIVLLSSKVGSTSQSITLLGVYEHPGIGSNDSTVVACKVVSRGGAYYLTFSKFYIPGLANPFSTTNTGGTNFLEVQISSALFPSTGTVVSLKVAILTGRKRY